MHDSPQTTLDEIRSQGLWRELRPLASSAGIRVTRGDQEFWNFSSNDYLGLAGHPELAEAMIEGVRQFGTGATASRLVCGTQPPHARFEEELAAAKQTTAALVFASGFATSIGLIPALLGPQDVVILDKLAHACLVDGARLSSATLRVFPHNDTAKLRKILTTTRAKSANCRILIATESVFSMDGDCCPLREIVGLAEEFKALLLLDEAHGFGVLGENGMGLAEREGLQRRITFQMGTLSKAAGLAGGYIAADRPWIDLLVNRARSFIFSTAPPPALAHAAQTALRIIRSNEGKHRREVLRGHISCLGGADTPIFPKILGSSTEAMAAAATLENHGFLVPAIRFPTVPRGTARLRASLSAAHPHEAVQALANHLNTLTSLS